MAETIEVKPEIIRWAIHRSGRTTGGLVQKFPQIHAWESNLARLTLAELEKLATATLTPLGFFFLPKPPVEELPVPDFRTVKDMPLNGMSPDLIETVNTMVMRQDWYRDYLRDEGVPELDFIGSVSMKADAKKVADTIKAKLGLEEGWAAKKRTWGDALSYLRDRIEAIDVVMVTNSVVGNNNRRRLSVDEFRGFVLCDKLAPLIFINGSDAKSAQVFTIFHELAHLWLGKSAIFDDKQVEEPTEAVEKFCNAVAAEATVPAAELKQRWPRRQDDDPYFGQFSRHFKVSPITIGRRLLELDLLTKKDFFDFYEAYKAVDKTFLAQEAGGQPNFYYVQNNRVGKRFARAVASAAYEGKLSYPDAFRLTGLTSATFDQYLSVAKGRKG